MHPSAPLSIDQRGRYVAIALWRGCRSGAIWGPSVLEPEDSVGHLRWGGHSGDVRERGHWATVRLRRGIAMALGLYTVAPASNSGACLGAPADGSMQGALGLEWGNSPWPRTRPMRCSSPGFYSRVEGEAALLGCGRVHMQSAAGGLHLLLLWMLLQVRCFWEDAEARHGRRRVALLESALCETLSCMMTEGDQLVKGSNRGE